MEENLCNEAVQSLGIHQRPITLYRTIGWSRVVLYPFARGR